MLAAVAGAALAGGAWWLAAARDGGRGVRAGGAPVGPTSSPPTGAAEPCLVPPTPPTLEPYRFAARAEDSVPEDLPRFVAAIRENGQLVLLRAGDGSLVRVLADPGLSVTGQLDCTTAESALTLPQPAWEHLRDLEVGPDGEAVYFVRGRAIHRVGITEGAAETEVVPGALPSFAPDGRSFAFGRPQGACYAGEAVVRDLAGGAEWSWRVPPDGDGGMRLCVTRLGLSPDGRRLAYTLAWEDPGTTYLLDVGTHDELGQASHRLLAPVGRRWTDGRFLPSGRLVVRELEPAPPESDREANWVGIGLVVVDPVTRRATERFSDVPADAWDWDVDPTGRHFLSVVGGRLVRGAGGAAVTIGDGIVAARWVT
jgi:hypothetical protein